MGIACADLLWEVSVRRVSDIVPLTETLRLHVSADCPDQASFTNNLRGSFGFSCSRACAGVRYKA